MTLRSPQVFFGPAGLALGECSVLAEVPFGEYTLEVARAEELQLVALKGRLVSWQLVLHGTSASREDVAERIR